MFKPKINENSRKLAECIDRSKYDKKKPPMDYSRFVQASRNPPPYKAATAVQNPRKYTSGNLTSRAPQPVISTLSQHLSSSAARPP